MSATCHCALRNCFDCCVNLQISNQRPAPGWILTAKQKTFIQESMHKLFLDNYFTEQLFLELDIKLKHNISFIKTCIFCLDKVLRENDRYIPLEKLCYFVGEGTRLKDYKIFIKLHKSFSLMF